MQGIDREMLKSSTDTKISYYMSSISRRAAFPCFDAANRTGIANSCAKGPTYSLKRAL